MKVTLIVSATLVFLATVASCGPVSSGKFPVFPLANYSDASTTLLRDSALHLREFPSHVSNHHAETMRPVAVRSSGSRFAVLDVLIIQTWPPKENDSTYNYVYTSTSICRDFASRGRGAIIMMANGGMNHMVPFDITTSKRPEEEKDWWGENRRKRYNVNIINNIVMPNGGVADVAIVPVAVLLEKAIYPGDLLDITWDEDFQSDNWTATKETVRITVTPL